MKLHYLFIGSLLAISANAYANTPTPTNTRHQGGVVQLFEIEQISPKIQNIGLKNEDAGETDETKIPDSVNDLETLVSNAGMTVTITWTPPTQDVSGNSLDLSDVTYAVLRSTDGRDYELLQQGITETKYVDNSIKEALDEIGIQQENFSYAVVATNTYGTNNEATAQFAVVGTPFSLPFKESFSGGYVQNNPWTVQSMTGTQGWTCISSDYDMYPQDYDEGFIKFYSPFGETVIDSRIISPLLDLTGTQNPSVTLYIYHWADAEIADEGKNTKLIIEVTEDSKTYTQVGETLMSTAEEAGWKEHRISLADYKDCKQLRLALRGNMDCYWMYYYVDNIRIEETPATDLNAMELTGPDKLNINETGKYTFAYANRGTQTVTGGYTLALYAGNEKVASVDGDEIAPGETKQVQLTFTPSAYDAGSESNMHAVIEIDDDYAYNNTSYNDINFSINESWYPSAGNLTATADEDKITISWTQPEIPTTPQETKEGVEDYEPFIIDNIGNWTVCDQDKYQAGAPYDFPDFPEKNSLMAFQVWNPYELDMELTEEDNWMLPRTGNQCFISWYVMTSIDGVVQSNDDWLISPELANGSTFSFYMRRLRTSTNETFQILSSSTDTYPSSFTTVEQEGIATEDWTLYEIPVKEGVRYIAIRYTGCDQYGLMIDDITYTSAIYYLKIEGYNLFRNGVKLNDRPLTETTYTDTDVAAGQTYRYSISTVYDRGESIDTEEVEVTMTSGVKHIENAAQCLVTTADGCIIIDNESGETVTVYNLGGTPVATSAMPGRSRIEVAAGAYIVKTGNSAVKVLVR